ncbi:uncharacterized protein F5891DRAFT_1118826, partial [Suillus fuscotomentosus]
IRTQSTQRRCPPEICFRYGAGRKVCDRHAFFGVYIRVVYYSSAFLSSLFPVDHRDA